MIYYQKYIIVMIVCQWVLKRIQRKVRNGECEMHTFRYLMPLDTMERISRQKLCDDFDNVLDRVDKEDIGFVILDDEGKEAHVLCPARWMEYCFDDDFGCIINSALRYAIRRESYMPSTVVEFIRKYIHIIDTKTISVAIRDIEIEVRPGCVSKPEMWSELKDELKERLDYLYKNQQEKKDK